MTILPKNPMLRLLGLVALIYAAAAMVIVIVDVPFVRNLALIVVAGALIVGFLRYFWVDALWMLAGLLLGLLWRLQ